MKQTWIQHSLNFARHQADFYSGCRKILTGVGFTYDPLIEPIGDITIGDSGFTNNKLAMLRRLYYNEEHTAAVADLWNGRLARGKYGSVSVSTYHHLTKGDPEKRSKRASVMGPCLTGVALTLLNDRSTAVDCFYRTTELFKKFPADLVFLRDTILPHFQIRELRRIRFHFANMTCHPMYFVTLIPHFSTIAETLETFESFRVDQRFYDWTVKWTARFLCDEYERGILKHAQSMRVRMDARKRIKPKRMAALQEYLRANHPGYRNEYDAGEDEDDE